MIADILEYFDGKGANYGPGRFLIWNDVLRFSNYKHDKNNQQ